MVAEMWGLLFTHDIQTSS